MGCINSKTDINDRHPNIFQVTNVNDQGRPITPGKLEVTEIELVFYQRGKKPTKWPLRSLRKYGFDTEVFSFECGRRCPTGQGIYAFKCKKAEQLFNVVQQYIIGSFTEENDLISEVHSNRRSTLSFHSEAYLNPISAANLVRPNINVVSLTGSISSNGPLSPNATSLQSDASLEHNNNKQIGLTAESKTIDILEKNSSVQQYVNIKTNDQGNGPNHVYMNVITNSQKNTKDFAGIIDTLVDIDKQHCYANFDRADIENSIDMYKASVPITEALSKESEIPLNYITVKEVNYAELDLDTSGKNPSTEKQESLIFVNGKGYATIDFQKTTALSQSVNPKLTIEEGSRKTRHNSSINFNNSLSD